MSKLRPFWRVVVSMLMGATALAGWSPVVFASDPTVLRVPGGASFADLGWSEDRVIAPGSPAVVRFRLPENARQGDPIWYGLTLKFEWTGTPGSVGDYAFLNGRWNEHAIYQFKVKRVTDLDDGFQWSMADAVNGSSLGYELGEIFRASSSNVAQIGAVTEGWNEVGLSLRLWDVGNDDIRVVISKESEIFATSWQPTSIDGGSEAKVHDNVIDLEFEGRNLGWAAPQLSATVLVWSGPDHDRFTWDLGPLGPLGTFDLDEKLVLEPGREPHRIDVELDWGTGRDFYTVWEASGVSAGDRFIGHRAFRSTLGAMAAIVVLWLCVPLLVSAARRGRRR